MTETEQLKRWEQYRNEMEDFEDRMASLAKDFLELGAYDEAARCAGKAETAKFIRGRMPTKIKV